MFWSWHVTPPVLPPPPPSMSAKLVQMNAVPRRARPKPMPPAPPAQKQETQEAPEPVKKPEPQKPEEKKQEENKQEEKRQIDISKKQEQEKKEKIEEEKKQTELKKKTELEKKKKLEEEKKKKEQDANKKAEEKKKADELAKRKKLAEQRKAELARQLSEEAAEDEQYMDAQADEEAAMSYMDVVRQAVERSWSRPPSARNDMQVELVIQLVPNGQVIDVKVSRSSGNDAFDRSAVAAVWKAERFPELQKLPTRVFDAQFRRFKILFKPEDLRL